jgi:putative oxidoreductase
MLVLFGLNHFLGFLPVDKLDGLAARYIEVMGSSYIFPSVGGLYLVAGSLILINRFVGLAMMLSFPIALNALVFHMTLDPSNMQPALLFVGLHIIVMIEIRKNFAGLFE